jgi:hypothetical protein
VPRPSDNIRALIAIDGCFIICTFSWTGIMLQSVFYLPIYASYFLSKMAIIRISARKLFLVPRPSHNIHALIAIDGCFNICTLSWTGITLCLVFYLPICASSFLSKMAIIRIWARKLVFSAMPITQYSCPHCDWWLFQHLPIKLNSDQSSIRVLSANLRKLFLVKDGNNSHLNAFFSLTLWLFSCPLALIN